MNNITVAGQLGRDAEMKYLPAGDAILNFSVADSQGGKDKPTIWWNCSLFGKRAESLAQYLMKGQSVTVGGSLTKREWTDKEGNKRESMDLRVADVALQGGKPAHSEAPKQNKYKPEAVKSGFDDLEDCPF